MDTVSPARPLLRARLIFPVTAGQPKKEQGAWGSFCPTPGLFSSKDMFYPRLPGSRSERQLQLYTADALAEGPSAVLGLDVAPSTLLPSYDPDTGLVLLTGKVGWNGLAGCGAESSVAGCLTFIPYPVFPRAIPVCSYMRCSRRPLSSWSATTSHHLTLTR